MREEYGRRPLEVAGMRRWMIVSDGFCGNSFSSTRDFPRATVEIRAPRTSVFTTCKLLFKIPDGRPQIGPDDQKRRSSREEGAAGLESPGDNAKTVLPNALKWRLGTPESTSNAVAGSNIAMRSQVSTGYSFGTGSARFGVLTVRFGLNSETNRTQGRTRLLSKREHD